MKRIRLKKDCSYTSMSTPYGVITHEYSEVRDEDYVYKEMEVEGQEAPEPVAKIVEEPIPEPEPVAEKLEEPVKKKKIIRR